MTDNWLDELDELDRRFCTDQGITTEESERASVLTDEHLRELIDAAKFKRFANSIGFALLSFPNCEYAGIYQERDGKGVLVPGAELLEWKRVEGGLPEDGQCVLVSYDSETFNGERSEESRYYAGQFREPRRDDVLDGVTHWSTMPKGPK